MKNLILLSLLFCCSLLGAQCHIQVFTPDLNCIGTDSVSFTYFVTGPEGGSWYSPQLNTEGAYNQQDLRQSPVIANGSFDTIFFIDQADPTCFTGRIIEHFPCGNDQECADLFISANTVGGPSCTDASAIHVNGGTDSYPIYLTLGDMRSGTVVALDTLFTAADTAKFTNLPESVYAIDAVDEAGCQTADAFITTTGQTLAVGFEIETGFCLRGDYGTASVVVGNRNGPFSYSWSTGETTRTITGQPGITEYRVTVTDNTTGCTGEGVVFAEEMIQNIAFDERYRFTVPCGEDSVLVIPDPFHEGFTYQWFRSAGDSIVADSFMAEAGAFFTYRAFNDSGCLTEGIVQVRSGDLSGYFNELFAYQDTLCEGVTCVGLETSVPLDLFAEEGYGLLWEGPDPQAIAEANSANGFPFFCTEVPGLYRVSIFGPCDTIVRSLLIEEPRGCSNISGTLYLDRAGDCEQDTEDSTIPNYLLTLTETTTNEVYYTMTDAAGAWDISLPIGEYIIQPRLLPDAPFTVCVPPLTVLLGNSPVQNIDVFLPTTTDCPQMSTTVLMPFLRRCFESRAYVDYNNFGSIVGDNAVLTVELDPFFVDVTATPAPSRVSGNLYQFDLGDVAPFTGGQVRFDFTISCEAELGQSHCVEASITPDKPCISTGLWNGALVSVEPMGCDGDSVYFNVKNIGLEQMTVPLSYVIVEDGIMLNPEPLVNGLLQPDEEMPIAALATGGTFHLITNQEPNAPASSEPTAVIEGCRGGGDAFSTGFTNILPLSAGPTTSSIVCLENVGSYDPNDKRGFPLGYGPQNNQIAEGTLIDYNIRFQNTGTDTAFTVIIRDTLPESLDIATLKVGTASHPFTVSMDTNRVMTFFFNDILLPDSTTNLAASQGGVTFTVHHDTTLQKGDAILNEAAIYFDFNEPVITNVSEHIIAKEGLQTSVRRVLAQELTVGIYPNPASSEVRISVPGLSPAADRQVQLTDLYGRVLRTVSYADAANGISLAGIPNGYYLMVVTDGRGVARGRAGFVVGR